MPQRDMLIKERYRADSNRCTSFCRALPDHSATVPDKKTGRRLFRYPSLFLLRKNRELPANAEKDLHFCGYFN